MAAIIETTVSEVVPQAVSLPSARPNRYGDEELLARQLLPKADDMLWAMFYYLPRNARPQKILCIDHGLGDLVSKTYELWPEAEITFLDTSMKPHQRSAIRKKGLEHAYLRLTYSDLKLWMPPKEEYDLVLSYLSLHQLVDSDKQGVLNKVYSSLHSGGIFVWAEQLTGVSPRLARYDWELCQQHLNEKSKQPMVLKAAFDYVHNYDRAANQKDCIRWMDMTGFHHVDVLWRYASSSVMIGEK